MSQPIRDDATRHMRDLFDVTPCGVYCVRCKVSCKLTRGALRSHLIRNHVDIYNGRKGDMDFQGCVRTLRSRLQRAMNEPLSVYAEENATPKRMAYCSFCKKVLRRKREGDSHFGDKKDKCKEMHKASGDCLKLRCGNFYPLSSKVSKVAMTSASTVIDYATSPNEALACFHEWKSLPDTLCVPIKTVEDTLKPYVRHDEDVQDWCSMFHIMISSSGAFFERDMMSYVTMAHDSKYHKGEDNLKILHETSDYFFKEHNTLVNNCPANLKARLQYFNIHNNGEEQTKTFCVRRSHQVVQKDARMLLSYLYRTSRESLEDILLHCNRASYTVEEGYKLLLIPRIFVNSILHLDDTNHPDLPQLLKYCLVMCFSSNKHRLILKGSGYAAQKLACVLYMIRVSCIAKCITLNSTAGVAFIETIQLSRTINLLCPHISHLRNMSGKKVIPKTNLVCSNGDIISSDVRYKKEIYAYLIPKIIDAITSQMNKFLKEDDINAVLETKKLQIRNWLDFDLSIVHHLTEEVHEFTDFACEEDIDALKYNFEVLSSYFSLALYGTGLGAGRDTQIQSLQVKSSYFLNGSLYYTEVSIKKGSHKASGFTSVPHKLCPTLSRLLLLYRLLKRVLLSEDEYLLATVDNRTHYMNHAMQEIFQLESVPPLLSVRHFFTDLSNIVFPDGRSGDVLAAAGISEKNHHRIQTATNHYSTKVENWEEQSYDLWYGALGYLSNNTDSAAAVDYDAVSDLQICEVLQYLFGANATWTSCYQEKMVMAMTRSRGRHKFISIPCGGGKTLALIVPVLIERRTGRPVRKRIFCPNYALLCEYHGYSIRKALGFLSRSIKTTVVQGNHIGKDFVHPDLDKEPGQLPDIMIFSLQALNNLMQHYPARIKQWVESGWLVDVVLDEIHTFYSEGKFRDSFLELNKLYNLGIPVTLMTGTMTAQLGGHLTKYLNLSKTVEMNDMDVVMGNDPIGQGFSFILKTVGDIGVSIVHDTVDLVNTERRSVHIICRSKEQVILIHNKLKEKQISVMMATSDESLETKTDVAEKWAEGLVSVLVTTTMGLVGNENSKVDIVLISDLVYDLSNTIQCIGRLRPKQRSDQAEVRQYLRINSYTASGRRYEEDEMKFNTTCQEYIARGVLSTGGECLTDFRSLHCINSLKEMYSSSECILVTMNRCFGLERSRCTRCTKCIQHNKRIPRVTTEKGTVDVAGMEARTAIEIDDTDVEGFIGDQPTAQKKMSNINTRQLMLHEKKIGGGGVRNQLQNPYVRKRVATASWENKPTVMANRRKINHVQARRTESVINENTTSNTKVSANIDDVSIGKIRSLICSNCIVCNSKDCDGTQCVPAGLCFICGGRHYRSRCPYNYTKRMRERGQKPSSHYIHLKDFCKEKKIARCCYDIRLGDEYHKNGACRFQKRMRRVVIAMAIKKKATFINTMAILFATPEAHKKLLIEYFHDIDDGRKTRQSPLNSIVRLIDSGEQLYVKTDEKTKVEEYFVNKDKLPLHNTIKTQQVLPLIDAWRCCETLSIDPTDLYSSYTILPRSGNVPCAKVFYIRRDLFGDDFDSSLRDLFLFFKNNPRTCKDARKQNVSGWYSEAGYGFMAGLQNTSISNKKGDRANLPFLRSQRFTSEVRDRAGLVEKLLVAKFKESFGKQFPSNATIMNCMGMTTDVQRRVYRTLSYPAQDNNIFSLPGRAYRLAGDTDDYLEGTLIDGGCTIHRDNDDALSSGPCCPIMYVRDRGSAMEGYDLAVFEGRDGGRGIIIPTLSTDNVCVVFINSRSPHGSVRTTTIENEYKGCVGLRIVPYASKHSVSFAKLFSMSRLNNTYIWSKWNDAIKELQLRTGNYDGRRHLTCYHRAKSCLSGSGN